MEQKLTEEEANRIQGEVGRLLDKVLTNRIERKAKSTILEGLFGALVIMILFTDTYRYCKSETGYNMLENGYFGINIKDSVKYCFNSYLDPIALIFAFFFALSLGIAIFVHALCQKNGNYSFSEEVEAAYAKTNNYPMLDIFLEIPISFKHAPLFSSLVWAGLMFPLVVVIIGFATHRSSIEAVYVSLPLAVITFLRMVSEACEYRVYSLNMVPDNGSGDDNDENFEDDVEVAA